VEEFFDPFKFDAHTLSNLAVGGKKFKINKNTSNMILKYKPYKNRGK